MLSLSSRKKCMAWNCLSSIVGWSFPKCWWWHSLYPWLPLPPFPAPNLVPSALFADYFFIFFLDDKTSGPDFFSICSFIPREHFEIRLVKVSYYDYEKWRLKLCSPYVSDSICDIINHVLETGIFPDDWKKPKVHPIFKSDERNIFQATIDRFLFYLPFRKL